MMTSQGMFPNNSRMTTASDAVRLYSHRKVWYVIDYAPLTGLNLPEKVFFFSDPSSPIAKLDLLRYYVCIGFLCGTFIDRMLCRYFCRFKLPTHFHDHVRDVGQGTGWKRDDQMGWMLFTLKENTK